MDLHDIEQILRLIDDWRKLQGRQQDEAARHKLTLETLASIRAIALDAIPVEWRDENYSYVEVK